MKTNSPHNHHYCNIIMSVPTSLTKQLLQLHHPDQKVSNEAVELSSEFLKLFIIEARRRAGKSAFVLFFQ